MSYGKRSWREDALSQIALLSKVSNLWKYIVQFSLKLHKVVWNHKMEKRWNITVSSSHPPNYLPKYFDPVLVDHSFFFIRYLKELVNCLVNWNFLQTQFGFSRQCLEIHYQVRWLVIERTCTKNSRKLMYLMLLLGPSWPNIIKSLLQ